MLNSHWPRSQNSACEFTRHLDKVLSKLSCHKKAVFNYIDDIVVSKTKSEHLATLQNLFQVLAQENIKLSISKCLFACKTVAILGHIFTCKPDGITLKASKKRTEAIERIKVPQNLKGLRAFLGACNFSGRYIKNFRVEASILYKLTSKKVPFHMTDKHIEAFNKIKQMIKESAEIYMPSPNATKHLYCDSSERGYSASLWESREDTDGNEKQYLLGFDSKSYGNKSFKSSQHAECFGMISSILNFKFFLIGTQFIVYSDYKALVDLVRAQACY